MLNQTHFLNNHAMPTHSAHQISVYANLSVDLNLAKWNKETEHNWIGYYFAVVISWIQQFAASLTQHSSQHMYVCISAFWRCCHGCCFLLCSFFVVDIMWRWGRAFILLECAIGDVHVVNDDMYKSCRFNTHFDFDQCMENIHKHFKTYTPTHTQTHIWHSLNSIRIYIQTKQSILCFLHSLFHPIIRLTTNIHIQTSISKVITTTTTTTRNKKRTKTKKEPKRPD